MSMKFALLCGALTMAASTSARGPLLVTDGADEPASGGGDPAPMKLVVLVRHPDHWPAPHRAEVHPDAVDEFVAGDAGWTRAVDQSDAPDAPPPVEPEAEPASGRAGSIAAILDVVRGQLEKLTDEELEQTLSRAPDEASYDAMLAEWRDRIEPERTDEPPPSPRAARGRSRAAASGTGAAAQPALAADDEKPEGDGADEPAAGGADSQTASEG